MLVLGPIAFAAPWVLGAVVVLPVIWWLLRLTPPVPRLVRFPAVRLLRDLMAREETPARTPPWLLALRLAIGLLVIVALAEPVLHSDAALPGGGPVLLVIDDGWSAARDWPARQRLLAELLTRAERQDRPVVVVTTAPVATPGGGGSSAVRSPVAGPMAAADARRLVQGLEPQPWPEDRAAALAALKAQRPGGAIYTIWLSNGLQDAGAAALASYLKALGGLQVAVPGTLPDLLLPPVTEGEALTAQVVRAAPGPATSVAVRLSAGDDRLLAEETASFAAGAATATVRFALPLALRNQAARLRLEGQATVAATVLLDERWQRRPVGLVTSRQASELQPLLNDVYYLDRALAPYSEVRRGSLVELLKSDVSVLILADIGALDGTEAGALGDWVARGGLLLRFAGPRLAHDPDPLLPVRLRLGDRVLGGALSWARPLPLAPFDPGTPFAGLAVPADVTVGRQVLAEPTLDIGDHTWARLTDGTPLVTADRHGRGTIVLVHTTASPDWSTLALSGLFVDMLRRLVALGSGVGDDGQGGPLAPLASLDGLGRLGEPPATALPIPAPAFARAQVGPEHPPGLYGNAGTRRALNLTAGVSGLQPLAPLPEGVTVTGYVRTGEQDLKPLLLLAALVLALADMVMALVLRGLLGDPGSLMSGGALPPKPPTRTVTALDPHDVSPGFQRPPAFGGSRARPWWGPGATPRVLLLAVFVGLGAASAQAADGDFAERATARTWLAFVVTGDPAVDQVSRAGLEGLAQVLIRRTAVDTGGVAAVSLETDELAFFPLLYWPVSASQPALSEAARHRVNDYLHHGGTILFDSRDDQAGAGTASAPLHALVEGLDIPPLIPLPADHVLTKSFYLLQDFPGRSVGGEVWIEAREERRLDGVSSVIVGGNDWAGAWAVDPEGRPLYAAVPGGERQRELAYRFGVNLVMYALTGNYKADQVHVPAILQRIGQ
jgi:hypothetical protein